MVEGTYQQHDNTTTGWSALMNKEQEGRHMQARLLKRACMGGDAENCVDNGVLCGADLLRRRRHTGVWKTHCLTGSVDILWIQEIGNTAEDCRAGVRVGVG